MRIGWLAVLAFCFGSAAVIGLVFYARPAYDASGWMAWARPILHGNLNLYGQPAWKPLPLIVTLPAALTGHRGQLWLWELTACSAAVGATLMAGRLAYRLSPRGSGRIAWLPPLIGALIAAVAVASMSDYFKLILQCNSDPLVVFLFLASFDRLFSRRYGWAMVLFSLAALGRPEVWPFVGLYWVWVWLKVPGLRWWAVFALLVLAAAWFIAPGLTSNSWLSPGSQALDASTVIHGSKLTGVPDRMRTLTGTAMQLEVLASLMLVMVRRNRRALLLAGAGILWTLIEIAFALHGWSASQRYLMEGGACLAVVGGVGAAHALTWPSWRRLGLRWVGAAAVIALAVASISFIHHTLETDRTLVDGKRITTQYLGRLSELVALDGGAHAIRSCGQPVTSIGWQSILAWELDMNTGNVGFHAEKTYKRGEPMMHFKWKGYGWTVIPSHIAAANVARCTKLARTTATTI